MRPRQPNDDSDFHDACSFLLICFVAFLLTFLI